MNENKWLNGNKLSVDIWNNKYRWNNETLDEWFERVSSGNPVIKRLIKDKKFLFGGRTLSNINTNKSGSFSNCYSIGYVEDSLDDIMETATNIAKTFKAQGGQGLSLSKIRPKGSFIKGQFKSDGIVPFMEIFNTITESISQGGCIAENELVQTDSGYKRIKDITCEDKVWTKIGFVPVIELLDKGEQQVVKVTTKKGYSISTTLDHKFCFDGFNKKPIKDFNIGDKVILIAGNCIKNPIFNPKAYIAANYLANGYMFPTKNGGNISTSYLEIAERIKECFESLNQNVYIKEEYNCYRIILSKEVCDYLKAEEISKENCFEIVVPEWIMTGDDSTVVSFLSGLIDSDGCVRDTNWKYDTVCKEYANQILQLFSRIGCFPSLTEQKRKNPRSTLYTVSDGFRRNYPILFSEKINLKNPNCTTNSKYSTPYTKEFLNCGNCVEHLKKISKTSKIGLYTFLQIPTDYAPLIFDTIESIEKIGKQHVYDIVLPKEHMFNCNGFYVSNSRKGALLMSLDIWHPEAETFITIKSDLNKINKANLSLEIDDEFMKCVKKEVTSVERVFKYEGGEYKYTVNPVKLFEKICEQAWDYGEPGIIYTNRFRNYNIVQLDPEYVVETCNPCVIGDTLILTNNGYLKIKDCVGKETNIWNGFEWSKVIPKITGHNKQTYKVSFSNGTEIICTENHKFLLKDKSRKELKDLKVGDKLIKWKFPVIDTTHEKLPDKLAYSMGFYSGDGYLKRQNEPYIYLYGEKENLVDKLVSGLVREDNSCDQHRLCLIIQNYKEYFEKDYVISNEYSLEDRLSWLAGLIDSDGTRNSEDGSISISSVNKEFLKKVQFLCHTLGIHSTLALCKKSEKKLMPNHRGGTVEYECKDLYRLTISAYNVKLLKELGLETYRVNTNVNPNRDASRFITITSIEIDEIVDDVYCLTESKNHTFIANGCLTGNCGEQPLSKHSACNLCSINLSEYVLNPFTSNARFDYESLSADIPYIVKAMDDVLEKNLINHALPEQKKQASDWRNIGIGIMGLGDVLIKLGLKYGNPDAIGFTSNLMKQLFRSAVFASVALAKERGSYPKYKPCVWDSEIMKAAFTEDELNDFKEINKLRNCSLLSIAPTGSIGTLLNVSTGCEPYFSLSYTRRTESLNGKESYYQVDSKIVEDYKKVTGDVKLPDYFVTSQQIDYIGRIKMQAALQEYCDTAISSTINLPESTSINDVKNLYIYGWEQGLKGLTIFRDNCKRLGILTTNKPEKKEEPIQLEAVHNELPRGFVVKADDNCIGLKRTLVTGCGTLHVTAYFDPITGELRETYLSKGSKGGCQNFMVGLSRMISLAARGGLGIDAIIDQLNSCGVCPSYAVRTATKHDTSKGACCPTAVGNALKDMYKEVQERIKCCHESHSDTQYRLEETMKSMENYEMCPECHQKGLTHIGGCDECILCGYTHCS